MFTHDLTFYVVRDVLLRNGQTNGIDNLSELQHSNGRCDPRTDEIQEIQQTFKLEQINPTAGVIELLSPFQTWKRGEITGRSLA